MYFLCCSMYFCVLCIVCFVTFPVLFVCLCVLNNCHWVATQLQLNISYHTWLFICCALSFVAVLFIKEMLCCLHKFWLYICLTKCNNLLLTKYSAIAFFKTKEDSDTCGSTIPHGFSDSAPQDAWLPGLDLVTTKNSQITVKLWPFTFSQYC